MHWEPVTTQKKRIKQTHFQVPSRKFCKNIRNEKKKDTILPLTIGPQQEVKLLLEQHLEKHGIITESIKNQQ